MDKMLKNLKDIKVQANFQGTISEFVALDDFTAKCKVLRVIPANIKLSMLPRDSRDEFINYLVEVAHKFVMRNKIDTWLELERHSGSIKTAKLLFQFGVRGELFPLEDDEDPIPKEEDRRLTFREFYELCQIQFHFDGSFGSFKKLIAKKYGSFAEYCLLKGYDINNTKWESDETAIRVAQKLGSANQVKLKSASLYKYLEEHNLLQIAFPKMAC